ncbi:MAG: cytochrome-c peroxidase [Elusimicrobia bacterium]|nr:cytochrome-c peroxidase [Elusimicrobiota bacterium]
MNARLPAVLALALLAAAVSASRADDFGGGPQYPYKVPLGLKAPSVPDDDPVTDAKVALGKRLYFDKRLSRDGTVSCATCHDPNRGWTDDAPVSTGIKGQHGTRSAPTVLNAAYMDAQFWDGRAASLEEQAKGPIENPVEMGFTHKEAAARIAGVKGYAPYFKAAFGDDRVDIDRIVQAIATFERTVLTGDSPYDRWEAGDKTAMSASAVRGFDLFNDPKKTDCAFCHSGFNFSDSDYHNLGVGLDKKKPDLGRFVVTKDPKDWGAFKTPTLRNLKDTAPYMHDGSEKTLRQVVEFYNRGGRKNPHLDGRIRPLHLTKRQVDDLVAFLGALNGDEVKVAPPALPE